MAIVLLITIKDHDTIELPILGKCIVGRSRSCDLMIDDKKMSAKHGSFEVSRKGELIYTDLGSTNGSHINENQVEKTQLRIYETLRLGNTIITIDEKRLNSRESIGIGIGLLSGQKIDVPELPTGLRKLIKSPNAKKTSVGKVKSSGQTLILDLKKKKK